MENLFPASLLEDLLFGCWFIRFDYIPIVIGKKTLTVGINNLVSLMEECNHHIGELVLIHFQLNFFYYT